MVLLICKQIYISTKTYTSYTAYLILRTYSTRYLLQMSIVMGFDVKGTNSKVVALGAKKGKYAIGKFGDVARGSKSYKEMKTLSGVNKQACMNNICRELNTVLVQPMLNEVVGMYSSLFEQMSQEIKRLNIELSGAEVDSPKNEAQERYTGDLKILHEHVEKVHKLDRQLERCNAMVATQSDKIFGSSDDDLEIDISGSSEMIDTLKTFKEHGKSIALNIENAKHLLYKQASNGMYDKSIKSGAGTNDRAPFPKGIAQMKKKEFVVKVKQYMESRPDQFSFVLPEARRSMDDLNKRTGVHFEPGTWDEQEERMRGEFKQQNERLFKAFELYSTPQELTASQSQYTYGLSGLMKSKGKCEKGDGLRILHYWLSTLSRVSTARIEEIETELQCLPVLFGTGGVKQIQEAVVKAEELLERGEEMECVVQYKTVLQIYQVLTQKNPLFVRMHDEYLRATVVAERRNSITDLRALMGDIKEVCDKICGGAADITKSVKVNLGMNVFSVTPASENRGNVYNLKNEETQKVSEVEKSQKRKFEDRGSSQQQQQRKWNVDGVQTGLACRFDKCQEKAFHHKKERGGHVHESGMCFEHFVESVREGKKENPQGVPLKGGKKMILKRGEDMKWSFKIMAVKEKERSEIQDMLAWSEAGNTADERIFSTFVRNKREREDKLSSMYVECEGTFDIADLEEEIKSERKGNGGHTFPVMSNMA